METLKIVKGQPFVLWIPTIMLNADGEQEIDAGTLTDVVVTASSGCDKYTIAHHAHEHWLVLEFDDSLKIGPYRITITGFLEGGRKFCLALAKPLEIVNWDSESNWDRFIVGDHIELTDHPFITGEFLTDAELEALKEEYREKNAQLDQAIADAEAAKETFIEKAEMLDGVAKQGDNPEATISDILESVGDIDIDKSDLAKEATLGASPDTSVSATIFGWLKSIRDFLVGIVTTYPYAKESTLATIGSNASTDFATIKGAVIKNGTTVSDAVNYNIQQVSNTQGYLQITVAKETTAEAAKQAALDAKTAAQAITGYALQGDNEAATNTAILAEIKSISAVNRAMTLNRGGELKDYTIFFDIDGTILYAFTHDEIMQLTELPEPYVYHDRLTFDRWSYTLEELRQANGWRDVGAHYYPTDGFGEFELDYRNCKSLTPHIGVKLRTSDGLIVDWGDGNVETLPAALEFDLQHTYAVPAKYLMRWKQENDAKIYGVYVWNDTKSKVVGRCVYPTNAEHLSCSPLSTQTENTTTISAQGIGLTMIEELAIPYSCVLADGVSSSGLCFNMPLLKAVSGQVGSGYFDQGTYTTAPGQELESALFVSFRNMPFNHPIYCSPAFARSFFMDSSSNKIPSLVNNNIERVATALTSNITELTTGGVITSGKLRAIPTPTAVAGTKCILNCKYLEVTPDLSGYRFETAYNTYKNNYRITDYGKKWQESKVPANCFENNYSLLAFTIQNFATRIDANAFLNCFSLEEFHVERSSVVDGGVTALAKVNAFSGCPSTMKIYVPADSVSAYQGATNWATYASQIFAEPE